MSENNPSAGGNVRRTHPIVIVAAGAVTLFCMVGIGVMTGLVPGAQSSAPAKSDATVKADGGPASTKPTNVASAATGTSIETAAKTAPVENANSAPAGQLAPIKSETLGQPNAKMEVKPASSAATPARQEASSSQTSGVSSQASNSPTPVYASGSDSRGGNTTPTGASTSASRNLSSNPEPVAVCRQCGTVEQVTPVQKQGQGSGAGAVLGGLIGGVVGHQVGGGRGRDVATVAGAVGGALIGNEVEKSSGTTTGYEVRVRLEDGSYRTAKFTSEPGMRIGDKVRFENGRLMRR